MSGPRTSPTSASSQPPAPDGAQPPAAEQARTQPVGPPSERPTRRPILPWRRLGLVVFGLLTVVYGLLVMSLRPAALASVAVLAGIALVVGGVVQLGLASEVEKGWRWLAYVGGVVGIAAGLAAFFWPTLTLFVLALIGIYVIIAGVDAIVVALTAERSGERAQAGAGRAR